MGEGRKKDRNEKSFFHAISGSQNFPKAVGIGACDTVIVRNVSVFNVPEFGGNGRDVCQLLVALFNGCNLRSGCVPLIRDIGSRLTLALGNFLHMRGYKYKSITFLRRSTIDHQRNICGSCFAPVHHCFSWFCNGGLGNCQKRSYKHIFATFHFNLPNLG